MSDLIQKWHALYTKPGCEKKVAALLSRKNITNYCPLKRQVNGRRKVVLEPLFESFVFVRLSHTAEMQLVRNTDGVINYVYWLGKPAVIQPEEIDIMKRFLDEYTNVTLEKIPLDVNGRVSVIGMPGADGKTNLATVKNNTVKILLPSLGYMMLAEVEKPNVEVITSNQQTFTIESKYRFAI